MEISNLMLMGFSKLLFRHQKNYKKIFVMKILFFSIAFWFLSSSKEENKNISIKIDCPTVYIGGGGAIYDPYLWFHREPVWFTIKTILHAQLLIVMWLQAHTQKKKLPNKETMTVATICLRSLVNVYKESMLRTYGWKYVF